MPLGRVWRDSKALRAKSIDAWLWNPASILKETPMTVWKNQQIPAWYMLDAAVTRTRHKKIPHGNPWTIACSAYVLPDGLCASYASSVKSRESRVG